MLHNESCCIIKMYVSVFSFRIGPNVDMGIIADNEMWTILQESEHRFKVVLRIELF